MTLQAEEEHTCSGIFAVMLSQKLEYVLIFNSFTNKIAHFVKEKKNPQNYLWKMLWKYIILKCYLLPINS